QVNDEVYTPALVVNGARMVVGSNRAAVRKAIGNAPVLPIEVGLQRAQAGLTARIGPLPEGASATLIIYDAVHATPVGAGQDAGGPGREPPPVRPATPPRAGRGDLPRLPPPADQGAVLLVQGRDLAVLGAAQVRATGEATV